MTAGILLIDKAAGPTSHDVVARVRRALGVRRIGHTGTLDPFATGLLILCVGRATRLARFLTELEKTYVATLRFGYATDTYDGTGTATTDVRDETPARDELEGVLASFIGRQLQHPPPFSAKRVGGKRLHRLAREGVLVAAPPVEVEIRDIELVTHHDSEAQIRVRVSSGTYIRSLAHDVGIELGVGAHLSALRRTQIGSFSVSDAVDVATLEVEGAAGSLLSPDEALRDLPRIHVEAEIARRVRHGRAPRWDEVEPETTATIDEAPPRIRIVGPGAELLAIGEPDRGKRVIRPIVVWAPPPESS